MNTNIKTWQDRMPAPHQEKRCTMNCGQSAGDQRTREEWLRDCDDCVPTTVAGGDPIAARDAEIAELRQVLAAQHGCNYPLCQTEEEQQKTAAEIIAEMCEPLIDDRRIADLVNDLRDIAIKFHATGQLRERIADVIVPFLKAAPPMVVDQVAVAWMHPINGSIIKAAQRIEGVTLCDFNIALGRIVAATQEEK